VLQATFKFATFNSPNKGNAALADKLKGFIQKWLTAGGAAKQVRYNYLRSKKVYSW